MIWRHLRCWILQNSQIMELLWVFFRKEKMKSLGTKSSVLKFRNKKLCIKATFHISSYGMKNTLDLLLKSGEHSFIQLAQGFSASTLLIFCLGTCPAHCRLFSNVFGLYPLDACSNNPKGLQMLPQVPGAGARVKSLPVENTWINPSVTS